MPITVEKLPNEPIIVSTFAEPMNYGTEVPLMFSGGRSEIGKK